MVRRRQWEETDDAARRSAAHAGRGHDQGLAAARGRPAAGARSGGRAGTCCARTCRCRWRCSRPRRSPTTAAGCGASSSASTCGSARTARPRWRRSCSPASSPTAPGGSPSRPSSSSMVCRRFGVPRVLLANQLVGREAIRTVIAELEADPGFELLCVVDSLAGVAGAAHASSRAYPLGRPLEVLLEGGAMGGRTGCRSVEDALAVARAVASAPELALVGIEGFEDVMGGDLAAAEPRVEAFLGFLVEIARACAGQRLFAPGPVILSAGGSKFFDQVTRAFGAADLGRPVRGRAAQRLLSEPRREDLYRGLRAARRRTPEVAELGEGLRPALEIWAVVQSTPEPGLAVLTMGKRDVSYDLGLPLARQWYRPGAAPAAAGPRRGLRCRRPLRPALLPGRAARQPAARRRPGELRHLPPLHDLRQMAPALRRRRRLHGDRGDPHLLLTPGRRRADRQILYEPALSDRARPLPACRSRSGGLRAEPGGAAQAALGAEARGDEAGAGVRAPPPAAARAAAPRRRGRAAPRGRRRARSPRGRGG